MVEYAFDLAAVDVEFTGDGALTVARLVVRVDGLLQGWRSREFRRTSPSAVRSGKPVTNQVTTPPVDAGPAQSQSDSLMALTCRNATQRDPLRRDERPWHGGGLGFESP